MPTCNVVLSERQQAFVEALVQSGRYQNASEVPRERLRLVEERERIGQARLEALRQAARQGWADISAKRYADVADNRLEDFILDPAVGRARAGRHRARWQGANRSDGTRHREDLQRRQRVRGRPDRVRSVLTREVRVVGGAISSVHAVCLADASGQLPDLGSLGRWAPGSLARIELGAGVRSWHLRLSRDHVRGGATAVGRPRHFVVYRFEPDLLVVGRDLHDAMESTRHLDPDAT